MSAPLVLLHGFTGGPESWEPVTTLLPTDLAVVAPALVGHRGATADGSGGFDGEVDRLAALLRARAPAFHLAGYSLGARLGVGLLVRHADLFVSATLIGGQAGLESEAARGERREADAVLQGMLEERGLEAFVAHWEHLPLFATQIAAPPALLAAQQATRLAQDARALSRSLAVTGLGQMPDYWNTLPTLTVPTTLLAGESDAKFSGLARRMGALLPRARVELVPGAGHNVVLERPDAVAANLLRSLGAGRERAPSGPGGTP